MSCLFLVRNFLSVKTACAIFEQYYPESCVYFSIESDDKTYFKKIANTVPESINVIKTLPIDWLFIGINYIKNIKDLRLAQISIKKILIGLNINELFINYPVHEKDALYIKVAKSLNIKVSFYEEGSCFYTGIRGRKKDAISQIKYWTKHLTLRFYGIKRGYKVSPDQWYSLLNIDKHPHRKISIQYKKIENLNLKYLFLSRPLTEDYPSVSLEQHISAISRFADIIPKGENLFIKFHPRESEKKQLEILFKLNDLIKEIKIVKFLGDVSAEDVIYNLTAGSHVCGFDSSTLIYGSSINKSVTFSSVLNLVYQFDDSNELRNLYNFYRVKFRNINFLT